MPKLGEMGLAGLWNCTPRWVSSIPLKSRLERESKHESIQTKKSNPRRLPARGIRTSKLRYRRTGHRKARHQYRHLMAEPWLRTLLASIPPDARPGHALGKSHQQLSRERYEPNDVPF